MTEPDDHVDAVISAQDSGHEAGHDYEKGSPHLRHDRLRAMVQRRLAALVTERVKCKGSCRVLEIGAGHGTFTNHLVASGAHVTVTEASSASADHLQRSFANTDRVEVRFDESGEAILDSDETWNLAVMTSVLHHIPDYVSFLDRLSALVDDGGAIFTVQDPLYYPRMPWSAHLADRAAYFAWRLFQGNVSRGLATRLRRLRGVYLDTEPSDLVEYHVVRQGVDEVAVARTLEDHFDEVEIFRYWSTQAPLLQRIGDRTRLLTTFGVEARKRRR